MQKWELLLVLLSVAVFAVNAKPTFDVLYKIAGAIENELIADAHGARRDPYRAHPPGYGPPPHGNGYYTPHNHVRPSNTGYPGSYPSPYPTPAEGYPALYPSNYPPNVVGTHYHGPYPSARPPHGQYPPNNYIQDPYERPYPGQSGSSSYGVLTTSNSYPYGGSSGYKNKGY